MTKRKTSEEFERELNKVSPSIMPLDRYVNSATKILVKCLKCDTCWKVTPNNLLRGSGCPECKRKNMTKTHEEFMRDMEKKNPNIRVLGRYVDGKTQIMVECETCHYKWKAKPERLLMGKGCQKCAGTLKKQHSEFVEELKLKRPNMVVLSEYQSSSTKVSFKCCICGRVWDATPNSVLRGTGCPNCSRQNQGIKSRKTERVFLEQMRSIHPEIEILGNYTTSKSKISVRCTICGNIWESIPNSLLLGRGCPKCGNKRAGDKNRKKHDDFVKDLAAINPDIAVLGEYVTNRTKILAQCKKCGNQWNVAPSQLLSGTGCPRCARIGTSLIEQMIVLSLRQMYSGIVLSRDRSAIGLELDIYIPELRFAVEYGAWSWHISKIDRDLEKIKRCHEKNIRIITVFDAYNSIVPQYESMENVWLYRENFSKENNRDLIKNLLIRICDSVGIGYTLTDKQLLAIRRKAHQYIRMMSTEELNKKLQKMRSYIKAVGFYEGADNKIACECQCCGRRFEMTPANLLSGHGCSICSFSMLRTDPLVFKEKAMEKNPNNELLEEYVNSRTSLRVKCKVCGKERMVRPSGLLKGQGCPECKRRSQLKTPEQFVLEIRSKNPEIELLEDYTDNKTKLKVRCKKCQYEWQVRSGHLLEGQGCPKCNKTYRRTPEDFVEEMKKINPDISILGEYTRAKAPVFVKCNNCNHQWQTPAYSLLRGSGCPICARKKRWETRRL